MQRDAAHIPFVDTSSYPLRAGNAVRPLVDGEPAFRRICEAVEAAQQSVWVTIAFLEPAFAMPDGRGSFFDVLDRAAARGLDVRVLFWRHLVLAKLRPDTHFCGTEDDLRFLRERDTQWHARWDQAHGNYCHHQKSWLVDAGAPGEIAFVGGINLGPDSMVAPGHPPTAIGNTHDVYLELCGPSATDVHHNFVQRWNEASDRGEPDGCWPNASAQSELRFPSVSSPPAGEVPVQIQRTVRRDRYRDGTPAPGSKPFDIAGGELAVIDQYRRAIEAAERSIYIEDQAIGSPEIVERLLAALERGVDVVFLAGCGKSLSAGTDRAVQGVGIAGMAPNRCLVSIDPALMSHSSGASPTIGHVGHSRGLILTRL
jgi:phosphatidylserine/phosphatidylglycerophosphate/cardiolipin synthase-like enzyme